MTEWGGGKKKGIDDNDFEERCLVLVLFDVDMS